MTLAERAVHVKLARASEAFKRKKTQDSFVWICVCVSERDKERVMCMHHGTGRYIC